MASAIVAQMAVCNVLVIVFVVMCYVCVVGAFGSLAWRRCVPAGMVNNGCKRGPPAPPGAQCFAWGAFGLAKRAVSSAQTACFASQYGPFCNSLADRRLPFGCVGAMRFAETASSVLCARRRHRRLMVRTSRPARRLCCASAGRWRHTIQGRTRPCGRC